MSYVQLSEGGFQVVYPLGLGSGSPELSKSYMDMASKLFTFTFLHESVMTCMCYREKIEQAQQHPGIKTTIS